MKISRLAVFFLAISLSALATAQLPLPIPPQAYNGQSYWFGPFGPRQLSVTSISQDDGGYAEFYNGPIWQVGIGGGPALQGYSVNNGVAQANFRANTALTVLGYIYIDGYFSLTATINGFTHATPLILGTSRFYIMHNVPVEMRADQFTDLALNGNPSGPFIPTSYDILSIDYFDQGADYHRGGTVVGSNATDSYDLIVDPIPDGGFLQVDIQRTISPPVTPLGGAYTSSGVITISSV